MKKINFKAILVIVLALVLALSFAACEPEDTSSPPPTTTTNTNTLNPPDPEDFLDVIEGLDLTIDNLATLTDRFELNIEFYAVVNQVEYKVAIMGNVDMREGALNADNNLAIEVTNAGDVVVGLYYSGAEDAFFLNVPDEDTPADSIKRYIDGFDFLTALHYVTDPEVGGFASLIPVGEVSLSDLIGDYMSYATFVFNDFVKTTEGSVTTYDFILDSAMIKDVVPLVGDFLPADLLAELGGVIDTIFGTEGFDINTFTIPDFDLHLLFDVDATKGLIGASIDLDVPAFTFKINSADTGVSVDAFNLQAGMNFLAGPVATDGVFTVAVPVPEIGVADGYTYFSPLNVNTAGTVRIDDEYTSFIIQSDINPFFFMDAVKLAQAKAYVRVDQWTTDVAVDAFPEFELIIIDGDVYVNVLDEVVEGVADYDYYTLDIQQAIDLIGAVIEGIDTLDLPDFDQIFVEDEDEDAIADPTSPDLMALVGILTGAGELIVDDVLTIDKDLVVDVIMALGIDDIYFENDDDQAITIDELNITAWLVYDAVATDKLIGARGEVELVTAVYTLGSTGTLYSPTDFIFCKDGLYKLDGTSYVLAEASFEGALYAPFSYVESATGTYVRSAEETYNYYVDINFDDAAEDDVLTVEVGEIDNSGATPLDVKLYDAVLTINYTGTTFVGFSLLVSDYTDEEVDVLFDLELSEFTFAWSDAGYVTNAACVAPTVEALAEYKDVLDVWDEDAGEAGEYVPITATDVLDEIQDLLYMMFGREIYLNNAYYTEGYEDYLVGYYGDAVTVPANPTREGYTFQGWSYDNPDEVAVPAIIAAFPTTFSDDYVDLYAIWVMLS